MISPAQIRGARAMLNLTQAALAERAGLSATALNSIERGASDPKASTLRAIQDALEAAGVQFMNHGQPGVRLAHPDLYVNGQPVKPVTFSVGDHVRYIGRDPELRGKDKVGIVCESDRPPGGGWVSVRFGEEQPVLLETGRLKPVSRT